MRDYVLLIMIIEVIEIILDVDKYHLFQIIVVKIIIWIPRVRDSLPMNSHYVGFQHTRRFIKRVSQHKTLADRDNKTKN